MFERYADFRKPTQTYIVSNCRESAVGAVTDYGLGDRQVWIPIPVSASKTFLYVVQKGSEVHSANYPIGNGVKWSGRNAEHHLQPVLG
jgi:hypothetical protein